MASIRLSLREADGGLPMVCLCCGAAATVLETRVMRWAPPPPAGAAGVVDEFFGGFGRLFHVFANRRQARLQAPLCERHKGHWRNRKLLEVGSSLGVGTLFVGSCVLYIVLKPEQESAQQLMFFPPMVALLGWFFLLFYLHARAIRAARITDDEIELIGISEKFTKAVEQGDRKRDERGEY